MKKISIVIPTCDRFTTLKYTLDSVLEIDDENLEVVVSDNCSTDGTKQYLSSIADRRLKTIHLSSRVGMPENFSSAIQGATGDYILVIGDDDLVIQNNLSCLRKFIEIKNPDIIYSTRGVLYWSGLGENSGQVILHTGKNFTKINSQHLLTTCYQGWLPWTYLPSIYNSIFSRRFLDRYIEHLSGRMFYENTISVDVQSALVFSYLSDDCYFFDSQVSVSGISANSNGGGMYAGNISRYITGENARVSYANVPSVYIENVNPLGLAGRQWLGTLPDMVAFYDNEVSARRQLPTKTRFISLFLYQAVRKGYVEWVKKPSELDLPESLSDVYLDESQSISQYFYNFYHMPAPIIMRGALPAEYANSLGLARYLNETRFNL
jgi:glycosyltransferase involved in cell wall biosynthesis